MKALRAANARLQENWHRSDTLVTTKPHTVHIDKKEVFKENRKLFILFAIVWCMLRCES